MISALTVRNFQSIRKADLELGRFTVVVGPSSSGKSALMRAIRMLANNARGSAYVTHGEKTASVTAQVEGGMVTLTRGEGVGEYLITLEDGQVQRFTKLGGAVPDEIGPFLGVRSKDTIHFAGQFDRPYLLDDSGAEVARTLGELTNVSIIFAGAREARRRQLSSSGLLKTRKADADSLREEAKRFAGLPAKMEAIKEAEALLAAGASLSMRRETLATLLTNLEIAEAAAARASEAAQLEVPSFDRIEAANNRSKAFKLLFANLATTSGTIKASQTAVAEADAEVARLNEQYTSLLKEAGTCPTCGQTTEGHVHA